MAMIGSRPPFREWFTAPVRPPSLLFLWSSGIVLFQLFYTAIFAGFGPSGSTAAGAVVALTNVLPLALLAITVRAILKTDVLPLGVLAQGAAHLLLAPTFTLLWYACVILPQSMVDAGPG